MKDQGKVIMVTDDVYEALSVKKGLVDSYNDVLRREFGLPPKQKRKPGRPARKRRRPARREANFER